MGSAAALARAGGSTLAKSSKRALGLVTEPERKVGLLVALVRAYNELADWDGAERVHALLRMPRGLSATARRTSGSRWHRPSWRPRKGNAELTDPGDRRPRR